MPFYTANNELHHDGKVYQPGDPVEMTEEQAAKVGFAVTPASDAEILARSTATAKPLNVTQTVELVAAAQSIEELDKLAEGEGRKGVLDAIDKRRAELATKE